MEKQYELFASQNEDQDQDDDQDVDLSDMDLADDDTPEVVKEKAQKAIDLAKTKVDQNKQLFARTKKAEGFILKDGKWVKPDKPADDKKSDDSDKDKQNDKKPEDKKSLSPQDMIALNRAEIHEDDLQEVLDFADYKKISVAEALKNPILKNTLSQKTEERETANATNTSRSRPSNAKPSGDKLLEKANSTGELPESDEGMDALIKARQKKK